MLFFLLSVVCGNAQGSSLKNSPFKVVGYFRGDTKEVSKYDYTKLTHLIYCFMFLNDNAIGFKNEDSRQTWEECVAMKKKYPHLKVLVALGGWGGCETCSDVFSTAKGRSEFAISVKKLLEESGADGIDIDWESPVIGGYKDHKASVDDKKNFTELIKELRRTLPPTAEICFDANSFKEFLDRSIEWDEVMPLVDFVNVMTYGLPTNKRGHTGHHTALYSSPKQEESIDLGVRRLDSMGIPKNKIVIGAAFYSFVVKDVDSVDNGLGRAGKFKENVIYRVIEENYTKSNGYEYFWDSVASAPFLYNKQLQTFVTYDDKRSVAEKTRYALKQQLGGIMFWKLNGDSYRNGLIDTIHSVVKNNK